MHLIIYKLSDKQILDYFDEGESCTHSIDGITLRVGSSTLFGFDTAAADVCHFSGTIPADLGEKLNGDFSDLENIVAPQRGYYKMNEALNDIEVA